MSRPTAPIAAIPAAALSGTAFARQFAQQASGRFPMRAERTNHCPAVDIDGPDPGCLLGNWG